MKKLIYADTFSVGAFHETFNASSLMMFSMIYDKVVYRASKSSAQCVERLIETFPSNVEYKSIRLWAGSGSIGNFMRYLSSAVWNIILSLKQRRNEVLYFNYNSLWAMRLINFIARLRKINVIIACHGEIGYLINGIRLNSPAQAGLELFTDPRWNIAPSLHFCVLGESILANVPQVVAAKHLRHFISYEHSFIPHKVTPQMGDGVYRIGTVGTIRKEKGLEQLLAMGEALKVVDKTEFYALGRVTCNPQLLSNAGVKFIPGTEKGYVPKGVLNQYIDKMDCLVFFYPTDSYKFTASGALFDAIDREKLILSLHNDYFDGIFDIANFGKLFDSIDEMITFVSQKGTLDKLQKIDFTNNKEKLSYTGAAIRFRERLEELELI